MGVLNKTNISPHCRTTAVKWENKKGMENHQPEGAAAQTGKDVNRDMEAATNEAGFRFSRDKSSGPERTD